VLGVSKEWGATGSADLDRAGMAMPSSFVGRSLVSMGRWFSTALAPEKIFGIGAHACELSAKLLSDRLKN
jgi:hypothetical protein